MVPLDQGGYSVYHIKNGDEVVYVGITNNPNAREAQHASSGRLDQNHSFEVQDRNLTYAEARGYEQADIRHFDTRDTTRIGEPIRAGDSNRCWSYDPARTDARAQAFQQHEAARTGARAGCG